MILGPNYTLDEMVKLEKWSDLKQALDHGLNPNVILKNKDSLFESILKQLQNHFEPDSSSVIPGPIDLLDTLIERGLSFGFQNKETNIEPIHLVRDKKNNTVKNFNPNPSPSQISLVDCACFYGQWDFVSRLLEKGFACQTPLHQGLIGRRLRFIQTAVSKNPDDKTDGVNIFENKNKPKMDVANQVGRSISPSSILESHQIEQFLEKIKEKGWDYQQKNTFPIDGFQGTALGLAVFFQDMAFTQALISQPFDLTVTEYCLERQFRPLEIAIATQNKPMVELLLELGAPLDINPDKSIPRPLAKTMQPLGLAATMEHLDILMSIAMASEHSDFMQMGKDAMLLSAANNKVESMKALHALGISYEVKTIPNGFMPIHQAANTGAREALQFLLDEGQGWNETSLIGLTVREILTRSHPELLSTFKMDNEAQINNIKMFKPKQK